MHIQHHKHATFENKQLQQRRNWQNNKHETFNIQKFENIEIEH